MHDALTLTLTLIQRDDGVVQQHVACIPRAAADDARSHALMMMMMMMMKMMMQYRRSYCSVLIISCQCNTYVYVHVCIHYRQWHIQVYVSCIMIMIIL